LAKERAVRRAARIAEAEKARASRERSQQRAATRRSLARKARALVPKPRRAGRLYARRTRSQRAGIVMTAVGVLGLVWYLVDSLPTRIGLTVLVAVTAPALVVISFDRRI
jgi:sRNA-binding protein